MSEVYKSSRCYEQWNISTGEEGAIYYGLASQIGLA